MQLELGFWPSTCVRSVLDVYLAMRAEGCTYETVDRDYRVRIQWLHEVFGELTPASDVTYLRLESVARTAQHVLRDVTIRKRLRFWASAVQYAITRGDLPPTTIVPAMPPWLKDDGVKCADFYTLAQYKEFRLALPPGRYRRLADVSFWTGMHTHDVESLQRWMLQPEHEWEGTEVAGRWWRRNHKNKKCAGAWIPCEPELRELAAEWKAERDYEDAFIVGPLNNVRRTFHLAAHRADVPAIRANLGFRASHATLLMAREYPYEYVRQVLGHEGEVSAEKLVDGVVRAKTAKRPTTLSSHYLRSSPDLLRPRT